MKKTLYDIPVNEDLIWDYEWKEEEYKTEKFFKWYLARVLTYGTAREIRYIDFEIIRKYLPELNLPSRIYDFWAYYLKIKEEKKYGNFDRISERISKKLGKDRIR